MAEDTIKQYYENQYLNISFDRLVANDELEILRISKFLGVSPSVFPSGSDRDTARTTHKSRHAYELMSAEYLAQVSSLNEQRQASQS